MKNPKKILVKNKELFWHGGKTLLLALQFFFLTNAVSNSFLPILRDPEMNNQHLLSALVLIAYPAITLIFFFVLWRYYDRNDDRSFSRFCQAAQGSRLLRTPAYVFGIILTVLTATPMIAKSFQPIFLHFGSESNQAQIFSLLVSLIVCGGGSVLRIMRLNSLWAIQKNLPDPQKKKPMSVAKRILFAVIFFLALSFLAVMTSAITLFTVSALTILRLLLIPSLIIGGAFFLLRYVILPVRNIRARKKFIGRLQKLQEKGELSFTLHGHPYLSILSERIAFGLTVQDTPHPDAKNQEMRTYRVTFANCKRKRSMIILCDRNIYQFVYALRFNMITRFARMGAVNAGNNVVSMPGVVRLTNHSFEFPEGEGERVLLIDPPPIILAIRNESNHNLIEIDNGSQIYGYSVYGKNAFVNMLERT